MPLWQRCLRKLLLFSMNGLLQALPRMLFLCLCVTVMTCSLVLHLNAGHESIQGCCLDSRHLAALLTSPSLLCDLCSGGAAKHRQNHVRMGVPAEELPSG